MNYIIELKTQHGWIAYQYAGSMQQARLIVARCKASGAIDARITPKIEFFKRIQVNAGGQQA